MHAAGGFETGDPPLRIGKKRRFAWLISRTCGCIVAPETYSSGHTLLLPRAPSAVHRFRCTAVRFLNPQYGFRLLPVLTVFGRATKYYQHIVLIIINTINGGGYWRSAGNIIYSSRVQAEKMDIVVMDNIHACIINIHVFFFFFLFERVDIPDRYTPRGPWKPVLNTKSFPLSVHNSPCADTRALTVMVNYGLALNEIFLCYSLASRHVSRWLHLYVYYTHILQPQALARRSYSSPGV